MIKFSDVMVIYCFWLLFFCNK